MATPTNIIPITDLPISTVGELDYLIASRADGSEAVRVRVPEVTSASEAVQDAIDSIVETAQQEASDVLNSLGYLAPVPYSSGVNVTNSRYTVTYDGTVYAPVSVPFTTTASFDPTKWRPIQGVTTSELSQDSGAALIGFKQLGVGAVSQDVLQELRRTIRPEHFGAIGDGIANDTLAFNRARDYIMSLPTGGVISCTPGKVYAFGSRWTINKQVGKQFRVDMNGATFTKTSGGWSGAIMYYGASTESPGEHLCLNGPGIFQSVGANSTGLQLEWAGGSEISNSVSFRNFRNGCFLTNSFAVRFTGKCSWLYSDVGAIVCSTICHNLVVDACGFYVNQRDIYFSSGAQAYNLNVTNSDLEGSLNPGSSAIVLESGGACIRVEGNYIEGKNGSPIVFGSNVEAFCFSSNWFGYNSGSQVWSNITSGNVNGNIFWDQQQSILPSVRDFDIGNNSWNGNSNRIYSPSTSATFNAGYQNLGGSYNGNVAAYRKDSGGNVYLSGMIIGSADGVAFSLPPSYRPQGTRVFICATANGGRADFARAQIGADGAVTVFRGTDTSIDLSAVRFLAAQ